MRVIHRYLEKEVSKDIPLSSEDANPGFLLTNNKGGFLLLNADGNMSKYCGAFFPVSSKDGWEMYKSVDSLRLSGREADTLVNNFYNVERRSHGSLERFYMPQSRTLLYEVEGFKGFAELRLDCRRMYDFSDMGRIYEKQNVGDIILFRYTKFHDAGLNNQDYSMYVAVAGVDGYLEDGSWPEEDYAFDQRRGSEPFSRHVYRAMKIKVDGSGRFVLAWSESMKEALDLARHARENYGSLKRSIEIYKRSMLKTSLRFDDDMTEMAYRCAANSMDSMLADIGGLKGMYAGLPWFHHFWTRDEAISVESLVLEERYEEAIRILMRLLRLMLPEGRISNRYPCSELGSADSVGWTFNRIFRLLQTLEKKGVFLEFVKAEDLEYIKKKLRFSITEMLKSSSSEGLIRNAPLETWMDTSYRDDVREGFRIEIQASVLSMYRLMRLLCMMTRNRFKHDTYKDLEESARQKVREVFWKPPVLCDGADDPTVRPNIFLAHYMYPGLLKQREWKRCLDNAINRLWLDWGGFATIDKRSPIFFENYTGEDNRSYHRGDSWFFLNNIAAMSLHKSDQKRYADVIRKVLHASTQDMLFKGVIGCGSELSSASVQRAQGSPVQTWSAATYIELADTLFRRS